MRMLLLMSLIMVGCAKNEPSPYVIQQQQPTQPSVVPLRGEDMCFQLRADCIFNFKKVYHLHRHLNIEYACEFLQYAGYCYKFSEENIREE